MTATLDTAPGTGSSFIRRRLGMALALALTLVTGIGLGRMWTTQDTELRGWRSGTAYVGEQQLSIEVDGWTYGAEGSVPSWIDAEGSWHDGGWPDCLQGKVGQSVAIRFQARKVTVDGMSWRPIVAVDCRG